MLYLLMPDVFYRQHILMAVVLDVNCQLILLQMQVLSYHKYGLLRLNTGRVQVDASLSSA